MPIVIQCHLGGSDQCTDGFRLFCKSAVEMQAGGKTLAEMLLVIVIE